MSDPSTPVSHASELFHGFDLTSIVDLMSLRQALELKFASDDTGANLRGLSLTKDQWNTIDKLQKLVQNETPEAELAKEFMRMMLAAPDLVKDEDKKLRNKTLGLHIVGAALHQGGKILSGATRRSLDELEESFASGGMSGKKGKSGGRDNLVSKHHATSNLPQNSIDLDATESDEDQDSVRPPSPTQKPNPKSRLTPRKQSSPQSSSSQDDQTQGPSGSEYGADDMDPPEPPRTRRKKASAKKKTPASKQQNPYHTTPPSHKPMRPEDRPVNGGINRSMAVFNYIDPDMCKFEFETVCNDPDKPGRKMAGRRVEIYYMEGADVDFTKKRQVNKLNKWRKAQIEDFDAALDGYASSGGQMEENYGNETEEEDEDEEDDIKARKRSRHAKKAKSSYGK